MKKYFRVAFSFVFPLIALTNCGPTEQVLHNFSFFGENCTIDDKDFYFTRVEHDQPISLQITAAPHYDLPETVELYGPQSGTPSYSYDHDTGKLTIDKMSNSIKLIAVAPYHPISYNFTIESADSHFKVVGCDKYIYSREVDDRETLSIALVADYGYYLPQNKSDFLIKEGEEDMFDYQYNETQGVITLKKIQGNLSLTSSANKMLYKVGFNGNDYCYINGKTEYEEDALKGAELRYTITCDDDYVLPKEIKVEQKVEYTYDNDTGLLVIPEMPETDLNFYVDEAPTKKPLSVDFVGVDCKASATGIEETSDIHLDLSVGAKVTLDFTSNNDYLLPLKGVYFTIDGKYAEPQSDYVYTVNEGQKTGNLTFEVKGKTAIKLQAYPKIDGQVRVSFEGIQCRGKTGTMDSYQTSFVTNYDPGQLMVIELSPDHGYVMPHRADTSLVNVYSNGSLIDPIRYSFEGYRLEFNVIGTTMVTVTAGYEVHFVDQSPEEIFVPDQVVEESGHATKPMIYREGYELTGWYLDQKCTQLFNFDQMFITKETTLYSGWVETRARVDFSGCGVQFFNADGQVINHLYTVTGSDVTVTIKPAGKNGDVFFLPTLEQIKVFGTGYSSYELSTDHYTYDKIVIKDISANLIVSATADFVHPNYTINDYTWEQISYISKGNAASSVFNIGDTKTISVENRQQPVRIIGFNHDDLVDIDGGKAGITFEFVNVLCSGMGGGVYYWYDVKDASNFVKSTLNVALQKDGEIYKLFPKEILDIVVPVKKKVHITDPSIGNLATYSASLFLLSASEIGVDSSFDALKEGTRYEYYLLHSSMYYLKKSDLLASGNYYQYWLRSPSFDDDALAVTIDGEGVKKMVKVGENVKYYGAPAFCI